MSSPRTSKQSLLLSRRLIGVLAFAIGAYMLQLVLRAHYVTPYQPYPQPHPVGPAQTGSDWQSLAFSIVGMGFGLLLILRPRVLSNMIQRNFPSHELPPEITGSTGIAPRIIGALLMSLEIYHIYAWFELLR
jgi:hypothetical protein